MASGVAQGGELVGEVGGDASLGASFPGGAALLGGEVFPGVPVRLRQHSF